MVREWLGNQAASGYVTYDDATGRYNIHLGAALAAQPALSVLAPNYPAWQEAVLGTQRRCGLTIARSPTSGHGRARARGNRMSNVTGSSSLR
jgi:hypothetical protein